MEERTTLLEKTQSRVLRPIVLLALGLVATVLAVAMPGSSNFRGYDLMYAAYGVVFAILAAGFVLSAAVLRRGPQ